MPDRERFSLVFSADPDPGDAAGTYIQLRQLLKRLLRGYGSRAEALELVTEGKPATGTSDPSPADLERRMEQRPQPP